VSVSGESQLSALPRSLRRSARAPAASAATPSRARTPSMGAGRLSVKLVFWAPGAMASFPTLTAPPPLRVASMRAAFSSVFVGLSALLSLGSTAVGLSPAEVVVPPELPRLWPLPEVTVEGPDAVGPLGGWLKLAGAAAAPLSFLLPVLAAAATWASLMTLRQSPYSSTSAGRLARAWRYSLWE